MANYTQRHIVSVPLKNVKSTEDLYKVLVKTKARIEKKYFVGVLWKDNQQAANSNKISKILHYEITYAK